MNVKVIKDKQVPTDLTGGEYATCNVTIYVNPKLPKRTQRLLVIHSVIENYCQEWNHNKIEELCEYIEDALDQI